jgi:4-amino-4-deoxy-L-arabinose transferase-like glycosyltransferase
MGIQKIKRKLNTTIIYLAIKLRLFFNNFLLRYRHEIALFFIVVGAGFLRFYKLNEVPPGISLDEAILIYESTKNFTLGTDLFFKAGLFVFSLFTTDLIAYRFFSAILGTLTVLLVYAFAKNWFNKRIGIFASFFTAISFWPILVSRSLLHINLIPILLLSSLLLATIAFRDKKKIYFVLLAAIVLLGLYSSIIFWVIGATFLPVFVLKFLKKPKILSKYEKEVFLAEVIVLAGILPGLFYFLFNTHLLLGLWPGFLSVATNSFKTILMFNVEGPAIWLTGLGSEPLLDPLIGALFLIGIIISLKNIHRSKHQFLFFGFLALLTPAIFSTNSLYAFKAAGSIPFVFVFSAIALEWFILKWERTFPLNKAAKAALLISIIFFISLATAFNYRKYFYAWSKSSEVRAIFNEDQVSVVNFLNNQENKDLKYFMFQNPRNVVAKSLTQNIEEFNLDNLDNLKMNKNIIFIILEEDRGVAKELEERLPGGKWGWYVSPKTQAMLFSVYIVE